MGTVTYLYNGIAGRRKLQQHQLGMEEQDCQNSPTAQTFLTKTLAHLFIPKYLITTPVQYTYHTLIQTVPPVQCSVNDLNDITENDQIKHELRK